MLTELPKFFEKSTWENALANNQDVLGNKLSQNKSCPKKLFRNTKENFHLKYFTS